MKVNKITNEYVRSVYATAPVERCEHQNHTPDYAAKQFDHWLAVHDAQTFSAGKQQALLDAAAEQERLAHGPRALGSKAVAFKRLIFANWLRERAEVV